MNIPRQLVIVCFMLIAQFSAVGQTGPPLRRPISPQQPMWLIHIDTWNYPDPQKIIALIPADIRPFVVMNISLSISHDETTSQFQVAEYGYESRQILAARLRREPDVGMVQPSSGGFSQFSDFDLSVYEEFYRDYPQLHRLQLCGAVLGLRQPDRPALRGMGRPDQPFREPARAEQQIRRLPGGELVRQPVVPQHQSPSAC